MSFERSSQLRLEGSEGGPKGLRRKGIPLSEAFGITRSGRGRGALQSVAWRWGGARVSELAKVALKVWGLRQRGNGAGEPKLAAAANGRRELVKSSSRRRLGKVCACLGERAEGAVELVVAVAECAAHLGTICRRRAS